jgi:hypothetical protein
MSRTRQLLVDSAAEAPRVDTMGEVARCAFGPGFPLAGPMAYVMVYGVTLLGQASYLLVMGKSIQQAFAYTPMCLSTAVAISCAVLAIPLFAVRRLGESVALCLFNTALIVVVIIVALYQVSVAGLPAKTHLVAPNLSFMQAFGAATNVVYSYAGQWMYFELMDTMASPEEFPSAFFLTGPFMVTTYLAVAILGYALGAGEHDIMASMPRGSISSFAAVALFAHVLIVYLVKGVVLARYLHRLCSPLDLEGRTLASYLKHGSWGVAMLVFGWVVANLIPFFSQLLGIIGGLFAGPINFLLPMLLYLLALGGSHLRKEALPGESPRMNLIGAPLESSSAEPQGRRVPVPDVPEIAAGAPCKGKCQRSLDGESEATLCRKVACALCKLPQWEVALILFTACFIILTMVVGVTEEVRQVVQMHKGYGSPLACHLFQHSSERDLKEITVHKMSALPLP